MGNTDRKVDGSKCNKTQLHLCKDFSRLRIHRDLNAHLIRFAHVTKRLKINNPQVILDVGCGDKQLAVAIYTNKYSKCVKEYHGVDLRDSTSDVIPNPSTFPMTFHCQNVCAPLPKVEPDLIVNFEVLEHVSKEQGLVLLAELKNAMVGKTTLLLSTPCYDPNKGQANNHIYEWGYQELKDVLGEMFEIEDHFGTFMDTGIGPNKVMLDAKFGEDMKVYRKFFDSNFLSNLFAPLFPDKSRNCMWALKLKK